MTQVGTCINGHEFETATDVGQLHYLHRLRRMDVQVFYAYSLWHYPDGIHFERVNLDHITTYMQCAGSAERMTIEVRREENGELQVARQRRLREGRRVHPRVLLSSGKHQPYSATPLEG